MRAAARRPSRCIAPPAQSRRSGSSRIGSAGCRWRRSRGLYRTRCALERVTERETSAQGSHSLVLHVDKKVISKGRRYVKGVHLKSKGTRSC